MTPLSRRLQRSVKHPSSSGGGGSTGIKPSPANTGVQNGVTLTNYDTSGASGMFFDLNGTNYQNLIFDLPLGTILRFNSDGLVLKNCRVQYKRSDGSYVGPTGADGGIIINGANFTVQYVEVNGGGIAGTPLANGTSATPAVVDHCYFHETNSDLIHFAQYSAGDYNQYINFTNNYAYGCVPMTGGHGDGVQLHQTRSLTFQNNVIDCGGYGSTINDAFYEEGDDLNLLVEGNWLAGGNFGYDGLGASSQIIQDNIFMSGTFQYDNAVSNNPSLPTFVNNTLDTGGTVTLNQV